ncbi:hypothetical protein OCGS_1213 [Oceaniovalibus guishaninsula JLT2003]|uniref:PilZ domain-containing protein n=1 Tax=Oceaniovalibus guishaninsula JLT2003 TaxID=1231392 RepID=K2I5W2_9RHOB|nr:PilZ domain-containing protein [Oceaniovalibus guishaninsula]EKE44375.1 hypothetical protein OCGS_1213 [Oceaniovalibus guishaninsula JLT2003]
MLYRGRRWPVDFTLKLRAGGAERLARVIDVSPGGMALTTGGLDPAVGDMVAIEPSTDWIAGEVRWRRGDRIGLAFAAPLDRATLNLITGGKAGGGAYGDLRGRRPDLSEMM